MTEFNGTSRERRPDTVSRDYLTAFSLGPVAIGDTAEGIVSYAWKGRLDGTEFKLSRALETSWDDETVWFETDEDTPEILELDFCFAQNGDPIVCMGMVDGTVWMYWFNSLLGQYVLDQRAVGRTPRIALDNPQDVNFSDVQLFYISDVLDGVKYRQQRDRYATEYSVPSSDVEDWYLEDVFRGKDARLHLLFSVRNRIIGRYSYERISSTMFPMATSADGLNIDQPRVTNATITILVLTSTLAPEGIDLSQPSVTASQLVFALAEYFAMGELTHVGQVSLLGIDLHDVVILNSPPPEGIDFTQPSVIAATNVVVLLIGYTAFEGIDFSQPSVTAATNVVFP